MFHCLYQSKQDISYETQETDEQEEEPKQLQKRNSDSQGKLPHAADARRWQDVRYIEPTNQEDIDLVKDLERGSIKAKWTWPFFHAPLERRKK